MTNIVMIGRGRLMIRSGGKLGLLSLAVAGIALGLVSPEHAVAQYPPAVKAWVAPSGPRLGTYGEYRHSVPTYYPPAPTYHYQAPPAYQPAPYRPYVPSYQPAPYRPTVPAYQPPAYQRR